MEHKNQSVRVLTAALLGVMTIPVAMQNIVQGSVVTQEEDYAIFRSQDDEGRLWHGEDIRDQVIEHRDEFRMQRRAYSRAVERCRNRLRDGEDIACPDFNNPGAYDFEYEVQHAAAPEEEEPVASSTASSVDMRELTSDQRRALRTYTRAGYCSPAAGEFLYGLCQSLLGEDAADTPTGFINDNVYLHSRHAAPPATLKLRLQMIDEAISGLRGRRDDVRRVLRYQGGLND